ncbi:MAG: long-chain fatty acid--CoA ligase, partial [Gammaproteobacteria bacterium]|nr:long-chain fatty acid--CoA ligase [Gammaproteobacteria bacterium]
MLYLLHHAIDRSAKSCPDKAAFSYQGEELSYLNLVRRANGLAFELADGGVLPGDRVGLLLPKCLEMPVGVYGCLKAGAVLVPLDTQSPIDRLVRIILDAEIHHLIVSPDQANLVSKLCKEKELDLRLIIGLELDLKIPLRVRAWCELTPTDRTPAIQQVEDDPAYMLYTSGSTGEPKGILHSHRSGLAYARLSAMTYDVTREDRLGNFAPLHFDQSTFDFYTGPLCGATTVLIPQFFGIATASLVELIETERLSIWYSVPAVLIQLVLRDVLQDKDLSNLRWILFGGEPFPPKHLQKLMALIPHATFSNVYGPTEVNQCTYFNIQGGETIQDSLPIGRVWENTEGLVVDENDETVPSGKTGELLIRSPTMMLGYWRRPELNKRALY